MCLFTLVIFDFILKASIDTSHWDSSCMVARQVGIYSIKWLKEWIVELYLGQRECSSTGYRLDKKAPFLFVRQFKSRTWKVISVRSPRLKFKTTLEKHRISRRHSISLLPISSGAYSLPILAWNRVWFSKELRECMNVFVVSIPNE